MSDSDLETFVCKKNGLEGRRWWKHMIRNVDRQEKDKRPKIAAGHPSNLQASMVSESSAD